MKSPTWNKDCMNYNISTGTGITIAAIALLFAFLLFFFSGDPSIHTLMRNSLMPFDVPAHSSSVIPGKC